MHSYNAADIYTVHRSMECMIKTLIPLYYDIDINMLYTRTQNSMNPSFSVGRGEKGKHTAP